METLIKKPPAFLAYLWATRPKTLTAGVIPIVVGTLLAYPYGISWSLMLFTMGSALSVQIATNLFNDALDFKKGTDTEERLGFRRATQSGWLTVQQVMNCAWGFLVLAFLFGIPLIAQAGWPMLLFILISMSLAYLYTGGPLPIGYIGLGDIFAFLFFGVGATVATYYVQTGFLDFPVFLAGSQIGCIAMAINATQNLRDIVSDTRGNKRTMAVRFGKTFARWEITLLLLAPFALNLGWIKEGSILMAFLPFLALPIALYATVNIWKHEPGRIYNKFFGFVCLLHLSFGILFCLGILTRI
jgi:1,4-dihydroxy-2-naphthoate octaprenyltransferase